jgi:hypothetical protein
MRFCLIHVHDEDYGPDEEAMVIVPGADKLAIAVPLDALPSFLSLLDEAAADLAPQVCGCCGEVLPGRPPEHDVWRDVLDAA